MKKLKGTHSRTCSWCGAEAVWREGGMSVLKYACETHQADLRQHEREKNDDYMTEADYQTWGWL